MFYQFPRIENLKEVETAIHGRDEFIIAERDWGYVVNYNVAFNDTFDATGTSGIIRRECRGIKFDRNGNLLARPLHKFFNSGERDETQPHRVDFSHPFKVLIKLDGSMIHPIIIDNQVVYCTKMGPTDVAIEAQKFADNHETIHYNQMALDFSRQGMTVIFEWCSKKNRIVIDYPEDMLVLTAIRNNHSGTYASYNDMKKVASHYNVPIVNMYNDTFTDIIEFSEKVQDMEGIEGFVVRFDNGHMLKLKCLKYLQLHKAKELLTQEKSVWEVILNNSVDDVIGFMEPDDVKKLRDFQKELVTRIAKKSEYLEWEVIAWRDNKGDSKKKFAVEFVNGGKFSPSERPILFKIWDGYNAHDLVVETLLRGTSTGSKLDGVRDLVGNLKFE